jgi:hypothetical protein
MRPAKYRNTRRPDASPTLFETQANGMFARAGIPIAERIGNVNSSLGARPATPVCNGHVGDTHRPSRGCQGRSGRETPFSGDRKGTLKGQIGPRGRRVPFLWKWAIALLPIAKEVNP